MSAPKFKLGRLMSTPGALALLERAGVDGFSLIVRHVSGDWGEVDADDARENDLSVECGFRVLSAYQVGGEKLWVITEADRSATTLLLPSEY